MVAAARPPRSSLMILAGYGLLAAIQLGGGRKRSSRPFSPGEERSVPEKVPVRRASKKQHVVLGAAADAAEQSAGWWQIVRATGTRWSDHNAARLGAALAYYSIFSLGPVMVIAISVAGLVFGADAVRGDVGNELKDLLGDNGAQAVQTMLAGAGRTRSGVLATLFGLGTLIFAAVGVVVQLKDALNTAWDVKPSGSGIWHFLKTYIVSLAGVLALGFLLLVSMIVTTALAAAGKLLAPYLPEAFLQIVSALVSFAVISLLFAMMFKWLPDAVVSWRAVWPGAILTAALFEVGKVLIGLYIGKQGLESTYGAAASIVVVLIWVYYSAQIFLIGAEFTFVYAAQNGASIKRAARDDGRPKPLSET
jgi:membrane protein